MTWFFNSDPVVDYDSALRSNRAKFARFFHAMLSRGFYLPPSAFESLFVSAAHSMDEIERTAKAARECIGLALDGSETLS